MQLGLGTGLGHLVPLILYLAAIGAGLLAIFWRPQIGLYFLVPLLPLQTTRYKLLDLPWGNRLIDVLLLCVIIGLVLQGRGRLIPKTPLNRSLAVLAVLFYVALWRGSFYLNTPFPLSFDDPRVSNFKNYMIMPLLFLLVVAAIREIKQIKIIIVLMALSTAVVNFSFWISTRSRDFSHFSYDTRDAGVLGYAGVNGFAAYIAQMLVFLFALYAFEKRKTIRLAILGLNAFGIYCLIYSFSRGAYLAFAVSMIFLALFRERKLLVGMLIVVIGWQVFLPTAAQERISMTYQKNEGLDKSAQERVDLWEDAWNLFSGHPVFGIGFDVYSALDRVEAEGHGFLHDTHDYYLKVLVETGIIGILVFLWLLGGILREGWRLFRTAEDEFLKSLGLGFAAFMVCAITLNLFGDRWTYIQVDGFLWVLLGCVVSGRMIAQRLSQEEEETAPELASVPSLATANRSSLA
jgi:putative inorganic carbon (HCO3(-)) transporter